ncbi:MAG: hypothetical protein KGD64_03700 [Candidatus Heimdallarchaeota archaeon]|nr:hypothetical protein [Candidatus Heimdallarchaeota archaeon]
MESIKNNPSDTDEIVVNLGRLEETINHLRLKRDEHNKLTKESLTERNKINQEMNELLVKAKEHMSKRDNLNTNVKECKEKRKTLQDELQNKKSLLEELTVKEENIKEGDIRKKRRQMKNLTEQVEKLEWNLQTRVLSSDEEKDMIQNLEKLSEKIDILAKEVHVTTSQTQIWREISSIQKQINNLHITIIDSAKESQIFHNLMNQFFQQVNVLRKKANDYHKDFLDNKKIADIHHKEFLSKVSDKNESRKELKEIQKDIRKKMQDEIRNDLEENTQKAYEKYEKGENLSMEEFRLLVEKGMI